MGTVLRILLLRVLPRRLLPILTAVDLYLLLRRRRDPRHEQAYAPADAPRVRRRLRGKPLW